MTRDVSSLLCLFYLPTEMRHQCISVNLQMRIDFNLIAKLIQRKLREKSFYLISRGPWKLILPLVT